MVAQIRYEKVQTHTKSPFRVIEIDTIKIDTSLESKYAGKHWHRSLEFDVPIENEMEVWVEGETIRVFPNAMFLVNSRCIHECAVVNPNLTFKGYAVQLKYDFIKEVIPNIDSYQFDSFFDIESHPYLFKLIHRVIKMVNSDSPYQHIRLQALAYELCYELASHYCIKIEENKLNQGIHKNRLVDVLSYLDHHASEPFDAQNVADEFHLSYGHLAKLFKEELGMTMKEYVNSIRVRNASFDLLATSIPIMDIALQHGFVSPKAFYKEFEKVYHMTPKQYRKNAIK